MVLPPHLPGDGKAPGQVAIPTPPAKGVGNDRAAAGLLFLGHPRHPVAQVPYSWTSGLLKNTKR